MKSLIESHMLCRNSLLWLKPFAPCAVKFLQEGSHKVQVQHSGVHCTGHLNVTNDLHPTWMIKRCYVAPSKWEPLSRVAALRRDSQCNWTLARSSSLHTAPSGMPVAGCWFMWQWPSRTAGLEYRKRSWRHEARKGYDQHSLISAMTECLAKIWTLDFGYFVQMSCTMIRRDFIFPRAQGSRRYEIYVIPFRAWRFSMSGLDQQQIEVSPKFHLCLKVWEVW